MRLADGRTQEFTLSLTSTTIDRVPDNPIQVADESASRKHTEIILDADGYLLRDLDSGNDAYIDGERISGYHIINGNVVETGTMTSLLRDV